MRQVLHYIGIMFIALIAVIAVTNWVFGVKQVNVYVRCGLSGKHYLEHEVHKGCKNIINCEKNPDVCDL